MTRKTVFVASAVALLLAFAGGALLYKTEKVQRWGKLIGQNQAVLANQSRSVSNHTDRPEMVSRRCSAARA